MIEQSLCHHLQSQLTEYYRLIAVLESQMSVSQSSEDITDGEAELSADRREEETGLTLKRLDVWIQEWRLRMRMMSVCVEGAQGLPSLVIRHPLSGLLHHTDTHGGALVNLIHGYTDNGDPFVRKFTDQLLEDVCQCFRVISDKLITSYCQVSKPFFATLHKWLFSGELNDPFSEFFVSVDPSLAHLQYVQQASGGQLGGDGGFGGLGGETEDMGEREVGLKLWEGKYQFRKEMLPSFVGEAFGRKVRSLTVILLAHFTEGL